MYFDNDLTTVEDLSIMEQVEIAQHVLDGECPSVEYVTGVTGCRFAQDCLDCWAYALTHLKRR